MEYNNYYTYYDALMLIALVIIISFLIIALCFKKIFQYINEREYIKAQMQSSHSKREYIYWKRKLKKLYLNYLPLIGRFLR